MNEQLRKAIREVMRIETYYDSYYIPEEVDASQAKLLRLIEMLVEQRDRHINELWEGYRAEVRINATNAELIAALEQGRDE